MYAEILILVGVLVTSVEAGCGKLPLSKGVEVEKVESIQRKQTVTLKCKDGYVKKHGGVTMTCVKGRKRWLGSNLICRKDTRCPDPGRPTAGFRDGNSFWKGDTVTFTCRQNFRLEGKRTAECLANKTWSSPLPVCTRTLSCPDPGFRENTNRTSAKWYDVDGFGPGDTVTYTCDKGFLLDEFDEYDRITCKDDGEWEVFSSGDGCQAVKCDPPRIKRNRGLLVEGDNYTSFVYGHRLRFKCNESYELRDGSSVISCDEYGGWTPYGLPRCERIKCPDPPIPENGMRYGNSFFPGDTITYVCNGGHTLRGSENRTCLETRQWSGATAICEGEGWDCPDPGIPVGALKSGSSYNIGDTVEYTCGQHFILHGSSSRVCLKNGMWSGKETTCRYKYGFESSLEGGTQFLEHIDTLSLSSSASELGSTVRSNITASINGSNLGRSLVLNNKYGLDLFLVQDLSGSISETAVNVSKEFLKAIVQKVGVSNNPTGTRVNLMTFSSEVVEIHSGSDDQTPEAITAAIDKLDNKGEDATALSTALVEVVTSVQTLRWGGGTSSIAMILLTDGKYNWGGNPEKPVRLLREMKVDIYCIGIGSEVDLDTLEAIGGQDQTIRLKDIDSLDRVKHLILNGSSINSYEECGVGGLANLSPDKDIEKFQTAENIKNWPWMARLFRKGRFECGATIIRMRWLLTAAHCFTKKYDLDQYDIRLGSLDRTDKADSIIFRIDEIYIHPNYTTTPHQLHDVALVKLEKTITATPTIRPICLPNDITDYADDDPNEVDWYKPLRWSVVTGWGHEKKHKHGDLVMFKPSQKLHFISLRIRTEGVCKSKDHRPKGAKLKYEKIFCAGDGKGRDACRGDSGGPLSVNMGKPDRVFQIGIVSFGYGCRDKDRYGYYVRVQDYLPWILSHVDEEE